MLVFLAVQTGRRMFALPMLLVLPRLALQYEAQLRGVLRNLL